MKLSNWNLFEDVFCRVLNKKLKKKFIELNLPNSELIHNAEIIRFNSGIKLRKLNGYDMVFDHEVFRVDGAIRFKGKTKQFSIDFRYPKGRPKSKYNYNHTTPYMKRKIEVTATAFAGAFNNLR